MTKAESFIGRNAVPYFYVLAFVISWGGILLVVGRTGIPGRPDDFLKMLPPLLVAMLAGPTISGIVMTALVSGSSGLRELFSGLLKWRVPARWWAVALLTAPLVMIVIPALIAILEPGFLPAIFTAQDKVSLMAMGIGAGISTLLEEIGWTGFAIPRLRLRHSMLKTGLITGFLWAAWHLLVNSWSSGDAAGALSLSPLLLSLFFSWIILTSFRVLMVLVYEHTQSLLVAWLMHFTLTAGNVILGPTAPGGAVGPLWSLIIGIVLWVIVAVLAKRGEFTTRRTT
jgi:membrane protease YdiL (CAAX protease family)